MKVAARLVCVMFVTFMADRTCDNGLDHNQEDLYYMFSKTFYLQGTENMDLESKGNVRSLAVRGYVSW